MTTNPTLIEPIGDQHAGVVGLSYSTDPELLRQCVASGQVEPSAIVAHGLAAAPIGKLCATERITWHTAGDLPDADTTVLIETDPDEDYSEPVFLGYHDGECWRDVHGEPLQVVAWAEPPIGTRAVGAKAGGL